MKIYIKYLLAFFLVSGCTIDEPLSFEKNSVNLTLQNKKIDALFSLKENEQRLAFDLLDKESRNQVWEKSLSDKLASGNFNESQKKLINKIIAFIKSGIPEDINQVSNFRDEWLIEAGFAFQNLEIHSIAYDISSASVGGGGGGGGGGGTSCDCNKGAFFTCGSIDPMQVCPTEPSSCTNPTPTGCGFLWQYPCNQKCVLFT